MNTLIFRRHYKLIIGLLLMLLTAIIFSGTRIMSYNFGEYSTKVSSESLNYTNDTDIFDDSVIHTVSLDLTQAQYDEMVTSYKENDEKEWQKVNITIDGVAIPNVGIRLKGNLTLRTTLGIGMGGDRMMGQNPFPDNGSGAFQRGNMLPEQSGTGGAGDGRMGMMGGGPGSGYSFELPGFLVAFDKYTDGQTYQGISRIALRIGNDPTFLNELTAYALYKELGYTAPDAVYSAVQFGDIGTYLYEISELLDDAYVEKYFPDSKGILYKAGNSVGFHYVGDDPTLYADTFEVASGKNKNDLSPLIKLLKFVTNSTEEEFAENIEKYIDLDSLYTLMAVDELIGNTDGFAGLGSNFYIYIDTDTGRASFLPWDYNLSFGGMGGGIGGMGQNGSGAVNMPGSGGNPNTNNTENRPGRGMGAFPNMPQTGTGETANRGFPGGMNGGNRMGGGMGNNVNDLKTKLLGNSALLAGYNAKLAELRKQIYTDGLAESIVERYADIYFSYPEYADLVATDTYTKYLDEIRSYIATKVQEEK